MRPMNEIEIELPQIVLDRADAAYARIRQQAAQESPAGRRVRSFPRAAGILSQQYPLPPPESWDTAAIWQSV